MKVLMLKDVGKVGQRNTVQDVSDGYALNYLIPGGLAIQATPDKIKEVEVRKNKEAALAAQKSKDWQEKAQMLEGLTLEMHVKANSQGHLYKQLSPAEIVAFIRERVGADVPDDAIFLNAPIKSTGEYGVEARQGAVAAKFKIMVKA